VTDAPTEREGGAVLLKNWIRDELTRFPDLRRAAAWSRRLESSFGHLPIWPTSSCPPRHHQPAVESASPSGFASDRCRVACVTNICGRPR